MSKMNCKSCSGELSDDARFCPNCGTPAQADVKTGGIFDSAPSASSPEDAQRIAMQILKPYADEAQRLSTKTLMTSKEWLGRCVTKWPKGPIPELRAHTQFFGIVYALSTGREQYEDVALTDLEELSRSCAIRLSLTDQIDFDVDLWKVILDPDGLRIKPEAMLPPNIEPIGHKTFHSVWWQFKADDFAAAPRPMTVALLRIPIFDEIRYTFAADMR